MTMQERIEEYRMLKRASNLIHTMVDTDTGVVLSKEVMEVLVGLSNIEYDRTQDHEFTTALINSSR